MIVVIEEKIGGIAGSSSEVLLPAVAKTVVDVRIGSAAGPQSGC